jgi:hypothetical protein
MTPAKGSAALMLEIALAEVGTVEGPKENETKYGAFTKSNFLPWCGSFLMWVANKSGVKIPNVVWTPGGVLAFKSLKTWTPVAEATPKPGDIVFFDFTPGGAEIEHVGIVIKDNGDGTIQTVEGNTSSDNKGSQRNGGGCYLKTRAYKKKNGSKIKPSLKVLVVGFGRPAYK